MRNNCLKKKNSSHWNMKNEKSIWMIIIDWRAKKDNKTEAKEVKLTQQSRKWLEDN